MVIYKSNKKKYFLHISRIVNNHIIFIFMLKKVVYVRAII